MHIDPVARQLLNQPCTGVTSTNTFRQGIPMRHKLLCAAITLAMVGLASDAMAAKAPVQAGHKFRGSIEGQYRTNTNINVAPASGSGFDFADLSEFDDPEEDEVATDDEEDDSEDSFADVLDVDPDEDEIEEEDAVDEDGDGIDDLIDPNADTGVDEENRFTAKLGLNHKYQFAGGEKSWNNAFKVSSDRNGDRSDLNKVNWAVTSGLEFAPKGSKHSFKPSLSYVTLQKDSSKFVSTFVASLGYSYDVSKTFSVGATYNYQNKDVTNPDSPDARIDTLALTAEFKATKEDILKFKYAPKVEDSSQTTRNTDARGWEITYTRKLPWEMTLGFGYKLDTVDHKNLVPNRRDDNRTYAIQLDKEFNKAFSMAIGMEARDRNSNIASKKAANESLYIEGAWKF